MLTDLKEIFTRLNAVGVRYLVCGGLAVVAHGHLRVTHDIDLALAMDEENLRKALSEMESLGFHPHLPLRAIEFADAKIREQWQREKNMEVFSFISTCRKDLVIDLFCSLPFDFDTEWDNALIAQLAPGFPTCPIVRLGTLKAMKRLAGRPVDLEDLKHLPDDPENS